LGSVESQDPSETFSFVSSPVTVDKKLNVFFTATSFSIFNGSFEVVDSWLIKVAPDNSFTTVALSELVPDAPDLCDVVFSEDDLPWPPAPDAVPDQSPCGNQYLAINMAPAIDNNGVIYLASSAQNNDRYSYLIAVNNDLTPNWHLSLRGLLRDGCGVLTPPNGEPGGCRVGATIGVDPATNDWPAGRIIPESSASPVITPDGNILLGVYTRYNYARGHLMKFSPNGDFLGAYDFGWDSTPGIWPHDGTYSVITKVRFLRTTKQVTFPNLPKNTQQDNWYSDTGSYCNTEEFCPSDLFDGPYYMAWLNSDLEWEYGYASDNTYSCNRLYDGSLNCTETNPGGFEWCINAPVIDGYGVVFANSEDGNLYALSPDGTKINNIFLNLAIGAAYTPLSLDLNGRVYTQNDGHLFVVGGDQPAGSASYSRGNCNSCWSRKKKGTLPTGQRRPGPQPTSGFRAPRTRLPLAHL